jgi:hypothetical protein
MTTKQKLGRVGKNGKRLGVGDKIRVAGIPSGLKDELDAPIKTVFERCSGRMFTIKDFDEVRVELHVGRVMGEKSYLRSIFLEPEFIELVWSKSSSRLKGRKKLSGGVLK